MKKHKYKYHKNTQKINLLYIISTISLVFHDRELMVYKLKSLGRN